MEAPESRIRPLSFQREMVGEGDTPLLTVLVVNSRSKKNREIVDRCIKSIYGQTLQPIELILVDNTDRFHTIGKCFNYGVENATAEWVLILGDDDYISPDYCASLWGFKTLVESEGKMDDVAIVSTFSTFFDHDSGEKRIRQKAPQGMCRKADAMKYRYNETLSKFVDIDFLERGKEDGRQMIVCPWHFGYFYRQHSDNISGRKEV